ncbi:N-acyl-D-amino-acid deacylase family protein [Sphingomonas sp.]|uniref:N-acyl-D-amino-acid deacylase family protein n=1 Tax=Sphingomonas sp. TaxID=28214 RepID=UPI002DD64997|nr:amidohydrolase family protein [Sphingomonas sp.]
MEYDVLIRGANIVDGTGRPAFSGDVGIRGDHIVDVGELGGRIASRTIDAGGLTLTPGFVDIHTHYDGQASWDSQLAPSSMNGVTSVGMGNCGVGFAPARPSWHDRLIGILEGVEDIPGTALAEGLTWDWQSFPEYLDALDRRSFTIDVGAHMPHAALRVFVMGDRGADHTQAPTDAEIAEMERLTLEAVEAGAMGFSTSRTWAHRDSNGVSINTLTAAGRELAGPARALRRAGRGVFQLVSDVYNTTQDELVAGELALIEDVARLCGRPLSFSLMQSNQAPRRYRELLDYAQKLAGDGLDVRCQVAPRGVGVIIGLRTTLNPFCALPSYRTLGADPVGRVQSLRDSGMRERLLAEARRGEFDHPSAELMRKYEMMFRMSDPVDYEPDPARSIAAEAAASGRDVLDYLYDVLLEEDGRRLLYMPALNYSDGDLDAVFEMMTADNTLFGLSDGGAHCGTICDASFPTTTLALWSRGSRNGHRKPIEWLVHGYTQRNARHVGWFDRGVIAPGHRADINLIDLDALALPPPELHYDLPAGGLRLMQQPRGYHMTLKNGVTTFDRGKWTGAMPGGLLRGEQRSAL